MAAGNLSGGSRRPQEAQLPLKNVGTTSHNDYRTEYYPEKRKKSPNRTQLAFCPALISQLSGSPHTSSPGHITTHRNQRHKRNPRKRTRPHKQFDERDQQEAGGELWQRRSDYGWCRYLPVIAKIRGLVGGAWLRLPGGWTCVKLATSSQSSSNKTSPLFGALSNRNERLGSTDIPRNIE
jgi:hypothetical protein